MTPSASVIRIAFALAVALGLATPAAPAQDSRPSRFLSADRPRAFSFPADHGNHPDYQTEWWYVTGNVDAADGRSFGFQFTLFRTGLEAAPATRPSQLAAHDLWLAHLALTDVAGQRILQDERLSRGFGGSAGAAAQGLDVRIDDWTLSPSGPGGGFALTAAGSTFALALHLDPRREPVLHGASPGWSRKGPLPGQSSYYASITRLRTTGTVTLDGTRRDVQGSAWFDHEFGSGMLAPDLAGWDWFALQFDDQSELMLYRLRLPDGTASPWSAGTFVGTDGTVRHLQRDEVTVLATSNWRSPRTKSDYPAGWHITVPSLGLDATVTPRVQDQELITEKSTRVTYWEGSVEGSGRRGERAVTFRGYVELVGYAGSLKRF